MAAAAQDEAGAGEYTRVGALSEAERAWDRQLADAGHTALAWRILGRDANGHLVAATTLGCGHDVDVERYCTGFRPQVCGFQRLALVAVAVRRRLGGAVAESGCAALSERARICRGTDAYSRQDGHETGTV